MDAQTILTLLKFAIPVVLVLAAYNLYLVFKLKNVDMFANWDRNKINGILMLLFVIFGTIASIWGTMLYDDTYILIHNPASDHGVEIDSMFYVTAVITGFVCILTNGVLFYFGYKYSGREGKKAVYYPENNKLEIAWTVVPAIVVTLLILSGMNTWWKVTGDAPADRIELELTGKQFAWDIRYPGADNKFGVVTWDSINDAGGNSYGYHFASDKNGQDDFNPQEIYLPVNKAVKVLIRSRDVLHCPTMPHFRMKIDAVPGMTTSYWFTPIITTDSMRKIRNNPKFVYELACQEICGGGHWNMRRVIHVVTQAEYDKWTKEQKPTYLAWQEANAPKEVAAAEPKTDTTQVAKPAVPAQPATPTPAPSVKGGAKVEAKKQPIAAPAKETPKAAAPAAKPAEPAKKTVAVKGGKVNP